MCVCVRSIVRPWRNFQNGRNKRRYRLATITGGELVKRLETCVGGNVKVSEWPIQCAVASGQTGPRSLAVFIWHARHSRGGRDERERETGYATTRDTTEKHRQTETGETANDKKTRRGNSIYRGKTDGNVQATAERKKERERARMNVRTRLSRTEGQKFLRFGVLSIRPDREKDAVEGQEVPVSARIKETAAKFLGNLATLFLSLSLRSETMARLREDTAECLRHLETRDGNRLARESCRVPVVIHRIVSTLDATRIDYWSRSWSRGKRQIS